MRAYSPTMFPTSVTFFPPGVSADAHGGSDLADATPGAVSVRANVQPEVSVATRTEVRHSPEGRKVWSVYTAASPAVGVDWLCVWNGSILRVNDAPSDQSSGLGLLWRTECERVS